MSNEIVDSIIINKQSSKDEPVYQQICNQLHKIIKEGGYPPGNRLPSMSFLAQRLKVNYRTVIAAFNCLERDGIISRTQNKIAVVSAQNQKGTSELPQKTSITISFVTCHHNDGFCVDIANGITRFAQEQNCTYTMINAGASSEAFFDALAQPGKNTDGLILLPFEVPGYAKAVQQAIKQGLQVVFVDRCLPGVDASFVETNHFSTAYMSTRHLLETHGRPVYHLGFVHGPSSCRDWIKGWTQAMAEYNFCDLEPYCFDMTIPAHQLPTSPDNGLEADIKSAMRLFKTAKEDVFCIYAGNDFIARGVYLAAEKLGLKIGRDVFVASSNDMPFCQTLPVPLTSVRPLPSRDQIGYDAAKLLHEHITGKITRPKHILLPCELIVRASSIGGQHKTGGGN